VTKVEFEPGRAPALFLVLFLASILSAPASKLFRALCTAGRVAVCGLGEFGISKGTQLAKVGDITVIVICMTTIFFSFHRVPNLLKSKTINAYLVKERLYDLSTRHVQLSSFYDVYHFFRLIFSRL
jgi:hypothetical protein